MKKSKISLVCGLCLATGWILLLGWLAASAINSYRQGRSPRFAQSRHQIPESRKISYPIPVNGLSITGDGTTVINIAGGEQLNVLSDPRVWSCSWSDSGNGQSRLCLRRLKASDEPVRITLPVIHALLLENCSKVHIIGLNLKDLSLRGKQVRLFHADSCRIGKLSLDFAGERNQQYIWIGKANRLDTLIASIGGYNRIFLETAGELDNEFSLAHAVLVETRVGVLQKFHNPSSLTRIN
ncbi:MAG: hypothetical protein WCO44_03300 [Bacteroidota bacterium]